MKKLLLVATLSFLSLTNASATVSATLSGPSPIHVSDTATFTAHITISPTAPNAGIGVDGFTYGFYSGDGQSAGGGLVGTGVIGSSSVIETTGPYSFDITQSFQYVVAGSYTPYFLFSAKTSSFDVGQVNSSYTEHGGYLENYSYSCGFFQTCYDTRFVSVDRIIHADNYAHYNFQYNLDVNGQGMTRIVVSVPEPETYAMLMAGLGLLGAVVRRRKSNQA